MVNTVKSFSISLRNLLHIPANLLQKQQKELGIQMVVNLEINLEGSAPGTVSSQTEDIKLNAPT